MAKGVPFNGSWHVERREDVSGPYVRGTEAVFIPLLAGTSFAVLTGIVGGGRQDYNVTLTPDPGREAPVEVYSARNWPRPRACCGSTPRTGGAAHVARAAGGLCIRWDIQAAAVRRQVGPATNGADGSLAMSEDGTKNSSASDTPAASSTTSASSTFSPYPSPSTSSSSGENAGATAGGVVGGVAGLLLIAGAAVLLFRRRHRQHAHTRQPFQGAIDSDDDERAAGEDRYRATVQGIVTPFTNAGGGTDTHGRQERRWRREALRPQCSP